MNHRLDKIKNGLGARNPVSDKVSIWFQENGNQTHVIFISSTYDTYYVEHLKYYKAHFKSDYLKQLLDGNICFDCSLHGYWVMFQENSNCYTYHLFCEHMVDPGTHIDYLLSLKY